ncbi:hypothetical protein MUP46_01070 [Patescibacteria group bacterium]|nr:hypothetical protein [Patescibacteria group bacterium]
MDAILELVVGLVLICGFLAGFIATVNTDLLPTWATPLLALVVGLGVLLVIWAFIKAMRKGGSML